MRMNVHISGSEVFPRAVDLVFFAADCTSFCPSATKRTKDDILRLFCPQAGAAKAEQSRSATSRRTH